MSGKSIKSTFNVVLFAATGLLTGCVSMPKPPESIVKAQGQQHSLYIVVDRDRRLPADFTTVFKRETQKRLPDMRITVDEGVPHDQELTRADWVVMVRATRIMPNYTFQPFPNSTLNGINDCLWGSGLGVGLIFAPCRFSRDSDFLEASIRDANGKTLKTYGVEESAEGWAWFPLLPFLPLTMGHEQTQEWENLVERLYDKIVADGVFSRPHPPPGKAEK